MGHQFARRTGHRERNWSDDQRSCIFLQWCDAVWQLTQQFPRHFEFNSHLLVTLVHHLYSCRFGTFFANTDMARRKNKLRERTVSLWTYFMCSPAAVAGEFTNQMYIKEGHGGEAQMGHASGAPQSPQQQPQQGAAPVDDDDPGVRFSYGRGGGEGSRIGQGAVLYPSFSLKRIALWGDYFLRWSSEQLEHVPMGANSGTVPPFGSTASRMTANEAVAQAHMRKLNQENAALSAAFSAQSSRVRELEKELASLKSQLGTSGDEAASPSEEEGGSTAVPASSSSPGPEQSPELVLQADASPSASPSDLLGAVPESVAAAVAEAEQVAAEQEEMDPAAAAAAAAVEEQLRMRLEKEVTLEVKEDVEAPEDPTTL